MGAAARRGCGVSLLHVLLLTLATAFGSESPLLPASSSRWSSGCTVTTVAGSGESRVADGVGYASSFAWPAGVAADAAGALYVSDAFSLRKISPGGAVSTVAGGAAGAWADGLGAAAAFNAPHAAVSPADPVALLYVADALNNRVRAVSAAGWTSTLAGSGSGAHADGTGAAAAFNSPLGVAADAAGTLYVADTLNQRVRAVAVASGLVSTLAGSGAAGGEDGEAAAATFDGPAALALGARGDVLYVADAGNHRLRTVAVPGGRVGTLAGGGASGWADGAGTAASFSQPVGVATDAAGYVYVADAGAHRIARISPGGMVTTLAGAGGSAGFADGAGSSARLRHPRAVAVSGDGSRVYVADTGNFRIRLLSCPATAPPGLPAAASARSLLQSSPQPPPPPPSPPSPPFPRPPPPDAYVAGLSGLHNLAYGAANVQVSSSSVADVRAALGYSTNLPLSSSYAQQCAPGYGGGFVSGGGNDTQPYYQVDLGAPAVVTDVQLWTTVGYEEWLPPLTVFVTNTSDSVQFNEPCFVFTTPDAAAASYQHACVGLGRYVTFALLSPNTAHPTSALLRFCALFVFGAYAPTPPPPLPPPLPPQAPPAPKLPFIPRQWWVIAIVLCLCQALFAIVLGLLVQCWVLRRRGAQAHVARTALSVRDEALRIRVKAQEDYERSSAHYERQASLWPSAPRTAQNATYYDDSIISGLSGIRTSLT